MMDDGTYNHILCRKFDTVVMIQYKIVFRLFSYFYITLFH